MTAYSVYEEQVPDLWVRYPQSFANKEAAKAFVFQRKQSSAYKDINYKVVESNETEDFEAA